MIVEQPTLYWNRGVGFYPVTNSDYSEEYFQKYAQYSETSFGIALNSLRVGLVSRYIPVANQLVDIGVGDGAFIRARGGRSFGYDVNPVAVRMLQESQSWCDVYKDDREIIASASFWDSLEHIERPHYIISKVANHCFVSIPIFRDSEHALKSKHFKPKEHYWYFTKAGLIEWFWNLGFVCVEMNEMETSLGREDIGTFVFRNRRLA
jgi:hypothetical protein